MGINIRVPSTKALGFAREGLCEVPSIDTHFANFKRYNKDITKTEIEIQFRISKQKQLYSVGSMT